MRGIEWVCGCVGGWVIRARKRNRPFHQPTQILLFLLLLVLAASAAAQSRNPSAGIGVPLDGLALKKEGIARQEGSYDRSGGNGDMRRVRPGETITLFDYKGAGIVQRLWVTIAPRSEPSIHRQAIIRMYWDGATTPCVESPIGDFFGVGFGEQVDYISAPLNQTSGGYNCYWPMPFHKSARWTLTNMSSRTIDAFYYNIDFMAHDRLPKEMLPFHGQWRRENPTKTGQNYTILEATGSGHFVGTAMFMQNRRGRGLGFLEGDEMIFVDGESKPSIYGTGTEDYFSSGWYYDRGLYSAPYHGIQIKDTTLGRVNTYRWHIPDPKPFKRSIKVTIEHGHANDHEGDYSSIAYWYQAEPHAPSPPLPDAAALLPYIPPPPPKIAGAIEAENLLSTAKATSGPIELQDMTPWPHMWSSVAQLWWRPEMHPATLTLNLPAPSAGLYEVTGYFTKARDYGKVRLTVGEAALGPEINLYDPNVVPTGPINLGRIRLNLGGNPLNVMLTGKDDRSTGYLVGIDAFVLKKVD